MCSRLAIVKPENGMTGTSVLGSHAGEPCPVVAVLPRLNALLVAAWLAIKTQPGGFGVYGFWRLHIGFPQV